MLGATSDRLPVKDWKYDRPVPGDALEATVRVLRSALTVIIKLFVRPVEFTVCAIKEAAGSCGPSLPVTFTGFVRTRFVSHALP